MVLTRARHLTVPILALGAALAAGVAPAAASIQSAQTDAVALALTPAAASGTLSCTGGTLTGFGGAGAGSVTDFGGLFYPGPMSITAGESCLDAGGMTGSLQVSLSGVNPETGGFIDCPGLTGSSTVVGDLVVATLQGTCSILGQPITPSSFSTVALLPATAGAGFMAMAYAEVTP